MPRQEYHFDKSGKLVKGAPPIKKATHDPLIKMGELAVKTARPSSGELKFKDDRELAKYCFKQAMIEKNVTLKDIIKGSRDIHYFPKSQAEYMAMTGFDGRSPKQP